MITCEKCGTVYPTDVTPLYCRCGRVTGHAEPKETKPNAWSIIHTRYADAIKSGNWNEAVERKWLDNEFPKLVPCSGCSRNWFGLSEAIRLSNAESAFISLWKAHNTVSTEHVKPPLIAMPYEQCRELWLGPKVAFLSVAYEKTGGTETFHKTLLPRLRHYRNILGFCATGSHSGNGLLLKVPYSTGIDSARELCSKADVVVAWGIDSLEKILPENRPKVIAVHHSDWSSGWSNDTIRNQRQFIDEVVCVNKHVSTVLNGRSWKSYWIPNAVDPERIRTTANLGAIKESIDGKKVCLFGHRMVKEKQPHLAVQIASYLPSDWIMVMVGDGPQKPTNTPSNVKVVGRTETLADWLSVANVFISLSEFDGFGLSMAEASAMQVPIVATPVGIAPQVATELLAIVAPPSCWARAIVEADGEQCPKVDFSVEKHVAEWAKVLTC